MPFKSKAQRGFMYSQHPKLAKEFEAATPDNAKLPEHVAKMAEGGEVKEQESDYGTLVGFREMLRKAHGEAPVESTGTAKTPDMAAGGQVPPLGQVMSTLNQTPSTNYDFYKDISAEDRAKLYQQLQQQKQGGGQAAISGLAGIGDAISNSFGGQKTNFQQNVGNIANQNMEGQLGAMDTQRSQRMQDMTGNQEAMMNDPKHPLSQGMRDILKSQGIPVPSGMNANVMLKVLGPLGELSMKQATLGIQQQVANQNQANQTSARKLEAAKGLAGRGVLQRVKDAFSASPETAAMQDELKPSQPENSHGIPDLGSTFNGGKVLNVKRVK